MAGPAGGGAVGAAVVDDRGEVQRRGAGEDDLLTRYQAHESAIRAGWKFRSEVRELEDLPPVAGIDDQDPPEGAVA